MYRLGRFTLRSSDLLSEDIPQYVRDMGWQGNFNRHRQMHECHKRHPNGRWMVTWVGSYESGDGVFSHVIAFRCNKCGCVGRYHQNTKPDESYFGPVTWSEWLP